jgi:hypothetical protein
MILRLAASALLLSAAGCMTPAAADDDAPPPVMGAGECDADAAQGLVGQAATAELGAEVLRLTGARALRWIQPGQAVTMDFRSDRVNIKLDAQNRVEAITCG